MPRPLVLIHDFSDHRDPFIALRDALKRRKENVLDIDVCTYVPLLNEISISGMAEGLERAFRDHPVLKDVPEFDAIVHSTGMLMLRSWLTNHREAPGANSRLKRLKHLIGLAPATWGWPQAHKGWTWIEALMKGLRSGPDFMNAGEGVLDGLELASPFTWNLAHLDLLGDQPYYNYRPETPFVAVFIGNSPYEGIASVADEPGTDGMVRWAGCALNSRKLRIDLTRTPFGEDGQPVERVTMMPWADTRLDIPMIAVEDRNHSTIIGEPHPEMVGLIDRFLDVNDAASYEAWLASARQFSAKGLPKMLAALDGWQQFVVYARDMRGDGITDYMLELLLQMSDGEWWSQFVEMYTSVHAYRADNAFRCYHVRLPKGLTDGSAKLRARIHASTGTGLMGYQGSGSEQSEPVEVDIPSSGADTFFHPFTTTLIEIVLDREPLTRTGTPILTAL